MALELADVTGPEDSLFGADTEEHTVQLYASQYLPITTSLARQVFERADENAYVEALADIITVIVPASLGSDRPHSQDLHWKRLALERERHRCHVALRLAEEKEQDVQDDLSVAAAKLELIGRRVKLQVPAFAAYVQRFSDESTFPCLWALSFSECGRRNLRGFLKSRENVVSEASDQIQGCVSSLIDTHMGALMSQLSHTSSVSLLHEAIAKESSSALLMSSSSRTSGGGISSSKRVSGLRPSQIYVIPTQRMLGDPQGIQKDKTELNHPMWSLLDESLELWLEIHVLTYGPDHALSQGQDRKLLDRIKKSPISQLDLWSSNVSQLIESRCTDPDADRLLTSEALDSISSQLGDLLQAALLPNFFCSVYFLDFLQEDSGYRLFSSPYLRLSRKSTKRLDIKQDEYGDEDYMDTRFIHGGRQRVKVISAYPRLQQEIERVRAEIAKIRGRLAVVSQDVLLQALAIIQRQAVESAGPDVCKEAERDLLVCHLRAERFSRKVSAQIRAAKARRAREIARMTNAATCVQAEIRRVLCQRRYGNLLLKWKTSKAVIIQRRVRGHFARAKRKQTVSEEKAEVALQKIRDIGRVWYRYRLYQRLQEYGVLRQARLATEDSLWAALTIQRVYRGHLARSLTIPGRQIEANMDNRLICLAEDYFKSEDLRGLILSTNRLLGDTKKAWLDPQQQQQKRLQIFCDELAQARMSDKSALSSIPPHGPPAKLLQAHSPIVCNHTKELLSKARSIYSEYLMPRRETNSSLQATFAEASALLWEKDTQHHSRRAMPPCDASTMDPEIRLGELLGASHIPIGMFLRSALLLHPLPSTHAIQSDALTAYEQYKGHGTCLEQIAYNWRCLKTADRLADMVSERGVLTVGDILPLDSEMRIELRKCGWTEDLIAYVQQLVNGFVDSGMSELERYGCAIHAQRYCELKAPAKSEPGKCDPEHKDAISA